MQVTSADTFLAYQPAGSRVQRRHDDQPLDNEYHDRHCQPPPRNGGTDQQRADKSDAQHGFGNADPEELRPADFERGWTVQGRGAKFGGCGDQRSAKGYARPKERKYGDKNVYA